MVISITNFKSIQMHILVLQICYRTNYLYYRYCTSPNDGL